MEIKIDELELLAQGGQSKIYSLDRNSILRVPQREIDCDRIKYEYEVYKLMQEKIAVPRVNGFLEVDGKPCLIMEKITGQDLVAILKTNLLSLFTLPKKLAHIHKNIFSVKIEEKLVTNHEKAKYCITSSSILNSEQKDRLLYILSTLETGTALCHGDFHPGNIIISNGKEYIIDWSAASYGAAYFDIAHTYLLMINTPRLDNVSDMEYKIQKIITRYIGKRYLKEICNIQKINPIILWKYFLIKAAERTFYGLETEKIILHKFITENIKKDQVDIRKIKRFA